VSQGKVDKLVRMANQIGDFFHPMPRDEGARGFATHIRRNWTPKMIRELLDALDAGRDGLNPTAARGVDALRREAAS